MKYLNKGAKNRSPKNDKNLHMDAYKEKEASVISYYTPTLAMIL
jgi:hypothetical protein